MPEDIGNEPANYKTISTIPQPTFASAISKLATEQLVKGEEARVVIPYDEISDAIPVITDKLARNYPEISADTIQQFCNFYFGGFNIRASDYTLSGNQERDSAMKVNSAKIQHNRAHSIFYASGGYSTPEYSRKVLNSLCAQEALGKGSGGVEIARFNSGVKSFLSISRYLYESGFDVYLPDYTGEGREVSEWDVKSGVDGVGVKFKEDGKPMFLLFDAKGQYNYLNDKMYRTGMRNEADFDSFQLWPKRVRELPESLQDLIGFFDPEERFDSVHRARIVLPTAPEYMMGLPEAYKRYIDKGAGAVLENYGRISPYVRRELDKQVKKISIIDSI